MVIHGSLIVLMTSCAIENRKIGTDRMALVACIPFVQMHAGVYREIRGIVVPGRVIPSSRRVASGTVGRKGGG